MFKKIILSLLVALTFNIAQTANAMIGDEDGKEINKKEDKYQLDEWLCFLTI